MAAVVVVCLGAWLGASGEVCLAQPPDREAELTQIHRQIGSLEEQLARIDQEKVGLEAELARTDVQVQLQESKVAELAVEKRLAQEAVEESELRAIELEGELERARRGLQRRLASLYRQSERDLLRSFLSSTEGAETLESLRALRLLTRRDAFWVDEYRGASEELEREREVLARRREDVERFAAREREELRRLARTRTLQQRALRVMEARREGVAEQASNLADKEEKLSLLIAILSGQETALPGSRPIQSLQGALDWPIRGRVAQGFGLRSEARYRTKIPHNGIEIETRRGNEVRAVFPGAVVFSSPFEDFGLTVVLHHPDRVFSLYAGLEAVRVRKGDVVSFADVLGSARDSVYFEIRVDNRPQDPLTWLR